MGGVAILIAAGLLGLLERCFHPGVLFGRKAGALDDMAVLMNEDTLRLHAALVFHHILFREEHNLSALDAREEAALAPIVEIQFLARLIGREQGDVGGQLIVGDDHAEEFPGADAFGDLGGDGRHHLVELVGRLAVGVVGDLAGGGDEDALDQSALPEELRVEFVFGGLLRRDGRHWRQRSRLAARDQGEQTECEG